jgi:hypothetical protein
MLPVPMMVMSMMSAFPALRSVNLKTGWLRRKAF